MKVKPSIKTYSFSATLIIKKSILITNKIWTSVFANNEQQTLKEAKNSFNDYLKN